MSSLFIKYEAITRHTAIVFMLMEILPLPEPEQSSKKMSPTPAIMLRF